MIARGRYQMATQQLETVARVNGRTLPSEMVSQLVSDGGGESSGDKKEQQKGSQSVVQVVKYPHLRKSVLLVLLVW